MTRKKWLYLTVFLLAAAAFAAWFTGRPPKSSQPPAKLTLGVFAADYSLPIFVAEEMGFFKQKGLEVAIRPYPYGLAALDGMIKGEVEIAATAETPFVFRSFERGDLRVLASIAKVATPQKIITRKGSGIRTLPDLRGRRIGVTRRTVVDFSLSEYLLWKRIPAEEITLIDLPPEKMFKALSAGQVDAVVVWDPYTRQIEDQLGAKASGWPMDIGQDYFWLLAAREDTVQKKSSALKNLLAAMVQADEFIARRPDLARKILRHKSTGNFTTITFSLSLDQALIAAMENQARWAVKDRLVAGRKPNYRELIYLKGLMEVYPVGITVFH